MLEDVAAQLEFRRAKFPGTEEIKQYVEALRAFLENGSLPVKRSFTQSFVKEVEILRDEITLTYTSPMSPKDITNESASVLAIMQMATPTGFEPAISALTGQYVKPLHHGAANRGEAQRLL